MSAQSARARAAAAIIAAAGLALLAAACGGSPSSDVAHPGSAITTQSGPSSKSATTNSQSPISQALAFAYCMRSHGVSNFPDPNSGGVFPKLTIYRLAAGNPKFGGATQACGHLLPNGGPGVPPSPAAVQQIQVDMSKFARCMRSHGVPNWPDPTLDRGRAVFNAQAVGIDTSPQIGANMHECEHVFPASLGIPRGA